MYYEKGSTQECSAKACGGETCLFLQPYDGYIQTTCQVKAGVSIDSVSVRNAQEAQSIIFNGTTLQGVNLIEDPLSCNTVRPVPVNETPGKSGPSYSRQLDANDVDEDEYESALSYNSLDIMEPTFNAGSVVSIIGKSVLEERTAGITQHLVSLVHGSFSTTDAHAGLWTFGARAIDNVDVFLGENVAVSTSPHHTESSKYCYGVIWNKEQVVVESNVVYPLNIFYKVGVSSVPRLEVYAFRTTPSEHKEILNCEEPEEVLSDPKLPPDIIFTFDGNDKKCAAGFGPPGKCTSPICDAVVCMNEGVCVAPNECECFYGREGPYCAWCDSRHWEIFGTCVFIWIVVSAALSVIVLIVFITCWLRYNDRTRALKWAELDGVATSAAARSDNYLPADDGTSKIASGRLTMT